MVGILAGALLGATDEALAAAGEARLRLARDAGGPNGRAAARYLAHAATVEMRLLTGRVVCQTAVVVLAYDASHGLGGWNVRLGAVAVAALAYGMTVGTAVRFAHRRAGRIALPLLRIVQPLETLFAPLAAPLSLAGNLLDRLYPPRPEDSPDRMTEVEVEQIIEQAEEAGSIEEEQAELLRSVIEFHETVAREVMVPRTSMVALEADMPLPEVVARIVEEGHSRYPVYRGSIDNPIGVLCAKDVFRVMRSSGGFNGTLKDLIRPAFFCAESQKISDLLRQLQIRRVHLAIVVDEYGGTSGIVALEDIIEEIVGEIRDEHDLEEVPVRKLGQGRYMVDADVSAHDVAELTGLEVPEAAAGFDSLGGLVIDLAGRVPKAGESVRLGAHDLIVRDADERRVRRIELVTRVPPAA